MITIVFTYLIFLLVLFRWDNSVELEQNSEAATVADHLFKELKTFVIPEGLQLKTSVLEAYTYLATRSKPKIDHAPGSAWHVHDIHAREIYNQSTECTQAHCKDAILA